MLKIEPHDVDDVRLQKGQPSIFVFCSPINYRGERLALERSGP
jgi:hypothetical protein